MVESFTTLSFEQWKAKNMNLVATLSKDLLLQKYKEYLVSVGGENSAPPTSTLLILLQPFILDISDKKDTTVITENARSNIDLVGFSLNLQQYGLATRNSTTLGVTTSLTNPATTKTTVPIGGNGGASGSNMMGGMAGGGMGGGSAAGGVASAAGGAADALDKSLFGDLRAKNSDLTNTLNDSYDAASDAIMTMGPYGAIIGGAMKVGGLISDGLTAAGVGTDQVTTADKILDSKFLKLTPTGLVNAAFAKKSDKFTVDNAVRGQIGGSYGGAYSDMDEAAAKAGKKYGLLSTSSRKKANKEIGVARGLLAKISDINTEARDMRSIADASQDLLTTNYNMNLSGGYDLRYMRAAKEGTKLLRIKKINLTFGTGGKVNNIINIETKEIEWQPVITFDDVPEYKDGGSIWKYDDWEPVIETFQKGGIPKHKNREKCNNELCAEFSNGTLRDSGYLIRGNAWNLRNVDTLYSGYNPDKYPKEWNLKAVEDYNADAAENFLKNFDSKSLNKDNIYVVNMYYKGSPAQEEAYRESKDKVTGTHTGYVTWNPDTNQWEVTHNIHKTIHVDPFVKIQGRNKLYGITTIYTPREKNLWNNMRNILGMGEGGVIETYDEWQPVILFEEGGKTEETSQPSETSQKNVIPEGALHARKHHMENTDGLTLKGIPVIDNEGELQAEIELNEIIFNLEITKKLEELCEDGSDEAAIEAGKLLVQEILYNTEDRTGLINTLKLGGTINGNTE